MIGANKEYLNNFFFSNLQFVVPFFQRSYVWKLSNWETLWEHLLKISEKPLNDRKSEHFIGTIITKQRSSDHLFENKIDLIDGQQRLTTFALILKAISTSASGTGTYYKLKENTNLLIIPEDSKGNKRIRIEHSKNDSEYFEAVMLDRDLSRLNNQEHKILESYKFFLKKMEGFTDEKLEDLKEIILKNIPVISMLLGANDDEQAIFDTINSLGVTLSTGELLKNFIFSDENLKPLYKDLWENSFEEDEDQIDFWSAPKTSGRVVRSNMEVLLYCYLIIEKGETVELEKLFSEYKSWLKEKSFSEKKKFLEDLRDYAEIFQGFPSHSDISQISFSQNEYRFFHIIENLEITTVYPLILFVYRKVTNEITRIEILKKLESYIVRRNVCQFTTKNYNKNFVQIIEKLKKSPVIDAHSLSVVFAGYTEETNKLPSDVEFKDAFLNEKISNSNAREILFCISLFGVFDPRNDVIKLSSDSYSTEHMMPQKWTTNWNVPSLDEAAVLKRNRKVYTLGNLTLVTKSLNSAMKNNSWVNKKVALLKHSSLKITTDYVTKDVWDEAAIEIRANKLAEDALKIW
jgi:uncharacterized protein with ParB-like and HNH nuclease domain